MSLVSQIQAFASRVAAEINLLRTEIGSISAVPFGSMILRNTDTSTNINTTSLTVVPIGGNATLHGDGFSQSSNRITTNFEGHIRLCASVYMQSTGARPAPAFEFYRNGTPIGPRYNTSYIRASSGHNEASCACVPIISPCSPGDNFTIRSVRDGGTATVTMNGVGKSYFMAERVN